MARPGGRASLIRAGQDLAPAVVAPATSAEAGEEPDLRPSKFQRLSQIVDKPLDLDGKGGDTRSKGNGV